MAVDQDSPFDRDCDRSLSLMEAPRSWLPLFQRSGQRNIVELADRGSAFKLPAHRALMRLLFLLMVSRRATELAFEPWRFDPEQGNRNESLGFRLVYTEDGQESELVPPPHDLQRALARELEDLAGLSRWRSRIAQRLRRLATRIDGQELPPRQGRFALRLGEAELEVTMRAYSSDLGERYFLDFGAIPDPAAAAALHEFERHFPRWDSPLCPDLR